MSENTQTAADGLSMPVSQQLVLETIKGNHDEKTALNAIGCEKPWWSEYKIGGFVNLVDLDESHPVKAAFSRTTFNVIYPEGLTLSTDPSKEDHMKSIKLFNKAVKKASRGVENPAKTFAKKSYNEALLLAQSGYYQVHCSVQVARKGNPEELVKLGIHAWTNRKGEVCGADMLIFTKVKIDKDTQLAVINEYR